MVLAIAGDIYRDELEGILEATFGKLPRGPGVSRLIPAEPRHMSSRTVFKRFNVKQAHIELSFPSITLADPDLYALDLLAEILGAGESALLVKKLKHEQKLVYSISASSWTPHYERGLFSVSITCHETNVQKVVHSVCRNLAALAKTPVDSTDLERARKKVLVSYFRGLQTASGRASELGENLLSLDDPQFGVRYAEGLQQVTAADIQRVAAAYLDTNTMVCTGLLPMNTAEKRPEPSADRTAVPENGFRINRLSNGIRVAWQPDSTVPLAALCLYLPAGQECETAQTCGLSDFLSHMLIRGTRTRTAMQIAEEIDRYGATLSYRSTRSGIAGTVDCLAEDTRAMLELLADTALNSVFTADELEKQRALSLAAIMTQYDSWSYEGYINFYSVFFAGHPYALPPHGDTNVIAHLSLTALKTFYERVIQPSNIVIAAAGAFEPDRLLEWCEMYFGSARPRGVPLPRPARFTPHVDDRIHTRGSPREQATVVLGYPGPVLSDPERYAVELADGFLGGLSGQLFQDLRMKHDLVYILGSFPFIQDSVGGVIALAQCEPRNARTVLAVMTNAYNTLRLTPLTDIQLASARRSLLIPGMIARETLSGRVTEAAKWEYFGIGANYARIYAQELAAVNAGDVQRAANTWFNRWTCVVTTPNDVRYRVKTFLDTYPGACAQDVYKMIFQATCGPGHLGSSRETVTANLEREWNSIEPEDGPLWFPIALDNDWAWFNLKAWKFRKGECAPVAEALWQSICISKNNHDAVARNWQAAAGLFKQGELAIADPGWRHFNTRVTEENYPVKHHTDTFIRKYRPAYRVLSKHIWDRCTADDSREEKMVQ
jgi:zinc protease